MNISNDPLSNWPIPTVIPFPDYENHSMRMSWGRGVIAALTGNPMPVTSISLLKSAIQTGYSTGIAYKQIKGD